MKTTNLKVRVKYEDAEHLARIKREIERILYVSDVEEIAAWVKV